jgi:hypothetical protein
VVELRRIVGAFLTVILVVVIGVILGLAVMNSGESGESGDPFMDFVASFVVVPVLTFGVLWLSTVCIAFFMRRWGVGLTALLAPLIPVSFHWLASTFQPHQDYEIWPTVGADLAGAVLGFLVLVGCLATALAGFGLSPARAHRATSETALQVLSRSPDSLARAAVAENPITPADTMAILSKDKSDVVRDAVAKAAHTPPGVLQSMVRDDPDPTIRVIAQRHLDEAMHQAQLDAHSRTS